VQISPTTHGHWQDASATVPGRMPYAEHFFGLIFDLKPFCSRELSAIWRYARYADYASLLSLTVAFAYDVLIEKRPSFDAKAQRRQRRKEVAPDCLGRFPFLIFLGQYCGSLKQ
jgi:hypothetical protein